MKKQNKTKENKTQSHKIKRNLTERSSLKFVFFGAIAKNDGRPGL